MNLDIICENQDFLVVNKPAGLVVHEGAGETGETLVDLVLKKYTDLKNLNWEEPARIGIVHRLDKDTSGVIIVAKNPETLKYFQEQFKSRTVEKTYLALVSGKVEPKIGNISMYIKRHPTHRRKMTVSYLGEGKPAVTEYKSVKNYTFKNHDLTLIEVKPHTGRMHQIRVHMKQKGYPVIGDQIYETKESKQISKKLNLNRQFLHAYKLKITIPGEKIQEFTAELPRELNEVIEILQS
jgi:23S rRNA pseudouridine1911/1915/1917 synthase